MVQEVYCDYLGQRFVDLGLLNTLASQLDANSKSMTFGH